MAKHLDLEEQEQLDQIKHFWSQYGNAITWALIAVLGSFAAWNGWNYWQTNQAIKAAALYDEVQSAAQARDVDRLKRALGDMQSGYAKTSYAGQSALLAARSFHEADLNDAAREALEWTVNNGSDPGYQAVARLRLASLSLEAGEFDAALRWLNAPLAPPFEPLASDRRGDVLLAQGKTEEATVQYQTAWRTMSEASEYRRLVEVKLASLGVDVLAQSTEVSR
ncbi:tetratricopeptide repeat protein [Hydrogenophaga sp.]|uniref:YfgM family protein n=1 Tax=Hydrogenophaga sp. TaxID=1904254 RepID=UPI0027277922|nr:tetratricopeptide repeat protein [Hydrogenophaga sp.]MDO8905998.1 tetratricopeptide repeat protein [Hydrogenophaga sp.]